MLGLLNLFGLFAIGLCSLLRFGFCVLNVRTLTTGCTEFLVISSEIGGCLFKSGFEFCANGV